MYYNQIFDNVSEALPRLLDLLDSHGSEGGSRAGRVKELTHIGITLQKPWQREILVNGRKPNIAAQIFETMWVLSGRDDMEPLSRYLPRAKDFSDDGETWRAGYGKRLRNWGSAEYDGVDQLAYIVDLLKRDPLSRQAVMSIWDPIIDTEPGKDIPCNNWLSFSSRLGKLDLHVAIRSNDAIWGWSGINAFEWSALQEIVAGLLGVEVGSLHFSTTSFHLYEHHWDKARTIVELHGADTVAKAGKDSPRFAGNMVTRDLSEFDKLCQKWFALEYDIRTGSPMAQGYVDSFPEPMLQSWLRVLQWWWSGGDTSYLKPLKGTALELATQMSVQPKKHNNVLASRDAKLQGQSDFIQYAVKLHNEKHAAYGDSWKRRGEMLGIMANIARKIDRLGKGETSDETSADTALDLFVYLCKYSVWLQYPDVPNLTDTPDASNHLMLEIDRKLYTGVTFPSQNDQEQRLRDLFDHLEYLVTNGKPRHIWVNNMVEEAYVLARYLFETSAPKDEYQGADHD